LECGFVNLDVLVFKHQLLLFWRARLGDERRREKEYAGHDDEDHGKWSHDNLRYEW
jgi:hypothetical protein